jgi:hypothetical protein
MSAQAAHFTISDVLDVGIKIVMTVMTPVRVMNAKMHSATGGSKRCLYKIEDSTELNCEECFWHHMDSLESDSE